MHGRMSVEHWETYYRGGGLVTCPTGPEPNYTLEAREVWAEFFAGLPEGARLVDLCTGNGPIPLIAKEVATAAGRHLEIHGVDLAQIAPDRHVKDGARLFEGIRFHPGTSAEQLPFESASVDAVTGQYALEYTDMARVLAEVSRVLRPGGRAQFVTHHRDSVVVRNAGPTFRQFHVLFEETRLLRRLRRFLELERESSPRARGAARELELALRQVEAVMAGTSFSQPALAMARDTVRRTIAARRHEPASRLDAAIDGVEKELRASWRRLQDLERCALDDAGVAEVVRLAAAAGLGGEGTAPLLHGGPNVIGWRINFRK
jgi:ubiquinone/menaquinone biosynthesis C-methylase UbiE